MEVMTIGYCPSCGNPMTPTDRFCAGCGTPAAPAYAPYPPYAAYPPPPRRDRTAMIIVLAVVLVVGLSVVSAAVLYVMVSGLITAPDGVPRAIGATIAKTPDGSDWVLTFTSVPTGLSPATTFLRLNTASGSVALPLTPLSSLVGNLTLSGGLGTLYLLYQGGTPAYVSAADTVLIGTATSAGTSTTGWQVQVLSGTMVLYSSTLQ